MLPAALPEFVWVFDEGGGVGGGGGAGRPRRVRGRGGGGRHRGQPRGRGSGAGMQGDYIVLVWTEVQGVCYLSRMVSRATMEDQRREVAVAEGLRVLARVTLSRSAWRLIWSRTRSRHSGVAELGLDIGSVILTVSVGNRAYVVNIQIFRALRDIQS